MVEGIKLRVITIVQARMGATRLPGKPLMEVRERPLLSYQVERLRRCRNVDEIVIATTNKETDQPIVDFCRHEQVPFFRGDENDVLARYLQAAKAFSADVVVRITGDCPLIDPVIVDFAVGFYLESYPSFDYVSNVLPDSRTYPRGLDVEVFSFKSLEKAALQSHAQEFREHVTLYIYEHPEEFKLGSFIAAPDMSNYRWTVDTPEDFQLISTILETVYPKNPTFTYSDLLKEFEIHPEWIKINAHVEQKPMRNHARHKP